jgi:hypothetical protein
VTSQESGRKRQAHPSGAATHRSGRTVRPRRTTSHTYATKPPSKLVPGRAPRPSPYTLQRSMRGRLGSTRTMSRSSTLRSASRGRISRWTRSAVRIDRGLWRLQGSARCWRWSRRGTSGALLTSVPGFPVLAHTSIYHCRTHARTLAGIESRRESGDRKRPSC